MAQRVDEAKYEAMITALNTFSANVYNASSEMQTYAAICEQALNEEDKAVSEIYKRIKECQLKYAAACKMAKDIAAKMQQELDDQRKEEQVWNSDD